MGVVWRKSQAENRMGKGPDTDAEIATARISETITLHNATIELAPYIQIGRRCMPTGNEGSAGVNTDGVREVLGMTVGPSEAEPFWSAFLRSLTRRGPRGVELLIADSHEG
jgi:hypothetical protein